MAAYKQIYQLVNNVNKQAWGKETIDVIDAQGLIATGDKVLSSSNDTDIWTHKLMDILSDQIMGNRERSTKEYGNIFKTSYEYGAAVQKIIVKVPDAKPESQWTLQDGQVLNNPTASFPDVEVKIFESHNVYRFDITLPIDQLKTAFMGPDKMAAFIAAIQLEMSNKIRATATNTARLCVNNFICEKYDYAINNPTKGVHAVNLLAEYNTIFNKSLTLGDAITDADFLRWSAAQIQKYIKRLGDDSTVFNINGLNRQTTPEHLNVIIHSEYIANLDTYLKSNTFHDNLVGLGDGYQETNFWQASGKKYKFEDTAKISMITSDGNTVEIPCVLGVAFDVDALGVCWEYEKMRNFYSAEYDVNHQIHSMGCGYFNDYGSENGVVFYLAEDGPVVQNILTVFSEDAETGDKVSVTVDGETEVVGNSKRFDIYDPETDEISVLIELGTDRKATIECENCSYEAGETEGEYIITLEEGATDSAIIITFSDET